MKTKLQISNIEPENMVRKKCILCNNYYRGYGNNPWPLSNQGRCCDQCNHTVIIARIKMSDVTSTAQKIIDEVIAEEEAKTNHRPKIKKEDSNLKRLHPLLSTKQK